MRNFGFFVLALLFLYSLLSCQSGGGTRSVRSEDSAFFIQQDQKNEKTDYLPSEPFIRINVPMHERTILRMSVDRDSKTVLTSSWDRTGRLWDADTGKLLKVFRLPITLNGSEREFGGCLSPDGSLAAFGAVVPRDPAGEKASLIFIFDAKTGLLDRTLDTGDMTVEDMTFSPDGRFLALGYRDKGGIKIYSTDGWKLTAELKDFVETVLCCTFAENGELAASSWDGKLRIYDSSFRLKNETTLTGGKFPRDFAFSPDAKQLAVEFADKGRIQLLSVKTLDVTRDMDVKEENLGLALSWSKDGKDLVTGVARRTGKPGSAQSYMIRRWTQSKYEDYPGPKAQVFAIKTLPDGSILWAGDQPDWGRLDPSGKTVYYNSAGIHDFKLRNRTALEMSDEGLNVGFSDAEGASYTFSLASLELRKTPVSFRAPSLQGTGTLVTEPDGKTTKINGRPFPLLPLEWVRCVDVSSDGNKVVLGASASIYLASRNADSTWNVMRNRVPPAWQVKIGARAPVFSALMDDGTVRWYRLADGKELLSLFVHPDGKRWILWTPSGYYAASPGGDSLIGWHVNNGPDKAADFFGADRFADRFCRPDIIALTAKYFDEAKAIAEANTARNIKITSTIKEMLPPVVTILDPQEGSRVKEKTLSVALSVSTGANTKVSEIKAYVDGRPAESIKGVLLQSTEKNGRTVAVGLSDRASGPQKISFQARNEYGWSEPASVNVLLQRQDEVTIKPRLYILAVGVSAYQDEKLRLNFAAKDAKDFAASWKTQEGRLYEKVTVRTLTDKEADKDGILDGLDWIQREATAKDVAIMYLSGHGVNDPNGIYYYLPVNTDKEKLKRTGVPFSDIKNTLSSVAGKVLLFLDTCHSGNVMGQRRGETDLNSVVNELSRSENGVAVFTSSTGSQNSLESSDWGNGAFTKAVLEGLGGKADYNRTGRITMYSLNLYISERVKELTRDSQTPTLTLPRTVSDFQLLAN